MSWSDRATVGWVRDVWLLDPTLQSWWAELTATRQRAVMEEARSGSPPPSLSEAVVWLAVLDAYLVWTVGWLWLYPALFALFLGAGLVMVLVGGVDVELGVLVGPLLGVLLGTTIVQARLVRRRRSLRRRLVSLREVHDRG